MDVYVDVKRHALQRARERFPELPDPRATVVGEVLDAIAAGRMATKLPRWCVRPERRRGRGTPSLRFVWNADQTRVYPIDRRNKQITVITVIRPHVSLADTSAA